MREEILLRPTEQVQFGANGQAPEHAFGQLASVSFMGAFGTTRVFVNSS